MHRPAFAYPSAPPAWLLQWPPASEVQALFAPGIRDYAGRVLSRTPLRRLEWTESSLSAEIGDQRPAWRLAAGLWTRGCTCGYKDDRCVHLYAVARCFQMAVRHEGWSAGAVEPCGDVAVKRCDGDGENQTAERSTPDADGGTAGAGIKVPDTGNETRNPEPGLPEAEVRAPLRPSVSFGGDDLFRYASAESATPRSQRLEAEVDFLHDPEMATLRFYLVTDGVREFIRMQDLYNLSYRARSGRPDPAMDRFPPDDIRLLRFLWSSLQEKDLCRSNLQVFKVPRDRFSTWLSEWISSPARFIERSSQQPVNACGGRASTLHFELRAAPEGQVDIAAVVTVPGGKNYLLHEIFQLLAGGKGQLVLDGKLLDFEPPVPWRHLSEFFGRKTPRAARRLLPELLPVVTAGRLDLVRGKIRHRTVEAAPSVEVKPDGAALLVLSASGRRSCLPGALRRRAESGPTAAAAGWWSVIPRRISTPCAACCASKGRRSWRAAGAGSPATRGP